MPAETDLHRELAPKGVLRVALNHGNAVLVGRDAQGRAQGISVDLARAFAARVGLEPQFIDFPRAVDVSSSATSDVWDICFLAVDPERARTIAFTLPYVRIEGCYLAGPGCDAADTLALVASGAPVGTVQGSAYTLTLGRLPGAAALVVFPDIAASLAALDTGRVAAIAGIARAMETAAATRPGARVLQPPFMEIRQAMATPAGRPQAHAALTAFLADAAGSGQLGDILERHGVDRACAIIPD